MCWICKKCDIKNNSSEGSVKACKKTEQATHFSGAYCDEKVRSGDFYRLVERKPCGTAHKYNDGKAIPHNALGIVVKILADFSSARL